MAELYLGVIHFPSLDRNGRIVTTSINAMEIHDMARICMTYGVELCYIVTPLQRQRAIMEKLNIFWTEGLGKRNNPERAETLKKIKGIDSIERMIEEVSIKGRPFIVGTSAKKRDMNLVSYRELKTYMEKMPVIILFGTGYGLPDQVFCLCDGMLPPIKGVSDYNHLPLRVAAGIIIDRILGRGGFDE